MLRPPPETVWIRSSTPVRVDPVSDTFRVTRYGNYIVHGSTLDRVGWHTPGGARVTWGRAGGGPPRRAMSVGGVVLGRPPAVEWWVGLAGDLPGRATYVFAGEVVTLEDGTWCRFTQELKE